MTMSDKQHGRDSFERVLRWPELVAIGVGIMIGAGAFVITGVVAQSKAGPSSIVSFLLAGLICLLIAGCYAEFASIYSSIGTSYLYVSRSTNAFVGWVIGWDAWMEYSVFAVVVAQTWSAHFNLVWRLIFGVPLPLVISSCPFVYDSVTGSISRSGGVIDLPAIAIVVILCWVVLQGSHESGRTNLLIVLVKLLTITFVIVTGLFLYFRSENLRPFAPFGWLRFESNGQTVGILAATAIVFFGYAGFDAIANLSEEAVNPSRDIPLATLASVAIATLIYTLLCFTIVGMVPYNLIQTADPLPAAFDAKGLTWAVWIISVGGLIGLTTVILVTLLSCPRFLVSISRDGLLPADPFASLSHRRLPVFNTVLITSLIVLFLLLLPPAITVRMTCFGTLLSYGSVCVSLLISRHRFPHLHTPSPTNPHLFRVRLGPLLPLVACLCCVALLFSLDVFAGARFVAWFMIGLGVYAGYGRNRVHLRAVSLSAWEPPEPALKHVVGDDVETGAADERHDGDAGITKPDNKAAQDAIVDNMHAALDRS